MKERLKKKHIVHEGTFINIYEDDVILPNDKEGKRLYISHPGGSGVLAITPDNHVILVKQFRYATNEYLLEIPAGKRDDHEDFLTTAIRELKEETGYDSDDISLLKKIYPTPGYSDEIIAIFIAKNVKPLKEKISADDDEFITIERHDKASIKALINEQKIIDSKTLIALQFFMEMGKCL